MVDISDNKRYIYDLLTKKKNSVRALQIIMEEKAKSKACLNNEQIEKISNFSKHYETKKENILLSIEKLGREDLNDFQKQMLHSEMDYEYLYNWFESMSKSQAEVISGLTEIIRHADETIRALC